MKWIFILLTCSLLGFSQEDLLNAPTAFKFSNSKAVFVDFSDVRYEIVYDAQKRTAIATSYITFYQRETGHAVIDLLGDSISSTLDGKEITFKTLTPKGGDVVKVASIASQKGIHRFVIKNKIKHLITFKSTGVSSAFWMSDLNKRSFLEKYLPTSFEHDRLNLQIRVDIKETSKAHTIVTNGKQVRLGKHSWEFNYPSFYTSSCLFFHLFPTQTKKMKKANFKSIDGRAIPIIAYSSGWFANYNIDKALANSLKYFNELESLYGPWPHDFFIAYIAGAGGMEYSGATRTSLSALRHEMNHSYFARNVVPARGNSGWIDEAIASWADENYPRVRTPRPTGVASHSIYRRTTDQRAYGPGSRLLGFLHSKFSDQGGFKKFLKFYFDKRRGSTVLTKDFQGDIEEFFSEDVSDFFNRYIYSHKTLYKENFNPKENPYHPVLSNQELLELL